MSSDRYRVHCPECSDGRTVESAFIARQLSMHHNLEYAHNSEWDSIDTRDDDD